LLENIQDVFYIGLIYKSMMRSHRSACTDLRAGLWMMVLRELWRCAVAVKY